jgi:hypothetical protein
VIKVIGTIVKFSKKDIHVDRPELAKYIFSIYSIQQMYDEILLKKSKAQKQYHR